MNKYNKTKRNKTKRNKTKQRMKFRLGKRCINKRKKTKKKYKGGDINKKIKFDCVNRMCKYNPNGEYSTLDDCMSDCHPPPPPVPPPPLPPDISSLKLINNFPEIRPGKLYILTEGNYPNGDNVFLFLPSLRPKPEKNNKEFMQEELDALKAQVEHGRRAGYNVGPFYDCMIKLHENIIKNYISGQNYDNYEYLNFRMTNSLSPSHNNLCIDKRGSNKWSNLTDWLDFNKPYFEYMKTKYTIYEFETWPEEIPRPPIDLTSLSADLIDISGDPWVDWDELASLEASSNCPPAWYFDRERNECAKIPSTYYG